MPSSKVKRAREKRDIQVHPGELVLANYKWSLKNWDGELLATQHFMVRSEGRAAYLQSARMGRYTLVGNILCNGKYPVYKHDEGDSYISMDMHGNWSVGSVAGYDVGGMYVPGE